MRNPLTGAVSGISASATTEDCREAVDAAYRAFLTWENSDYSVRQNIFLKAAQIAASEKYMHKVQEAIAAETAATPDWNFINWASTQNRLVSAAAMVRELKGEAFPKCHWWSCYGPAPSRRRHVTTYFLCIRALLTDSSLGIALGMLRFHSVYVQLWFLLSVVIRLSQEFRGTALELKPLSLNYSMRSDPRSLNR